MKILFVILLFLTAPALAQEVDKSYLLDPSLVGSLETAETGYKDSLNYYEAVNYSRFVGLVKVTLWFLVLLGLFHAWKQREKIKILFIKIYKSRVFRLGASVYIIWCLIIGFLYSGIAYSLFGIYAGDSDSASFLLAVPPVLAGAVYFMYQWCKKGE